jgi:predicted ester cyclase
MSEALDVAKRHDEAFNTHDAEARLGIEAPDIEFVMPGGVTLLGSKNMLPVVQSFWEALPDAAIVPENYFTSGDVVVTEGQIVGTHKGPFRTPQGEIAATGNNVKLRYAAIKRVAGGKLVSEHLFFDQMEFLQQLGAMPQQ